MVYGKTEDEKRTYCREMYHKTGAQLGYYYANCEKINRGNLLKRMKKNGVMPKKETLQKYNITQEEIDEYIPKKESVPGSTLPWNREHTRRTGVSPRVDFFKEIIFVL